MLHHPRVLLPRQVRSGPKPLSHAPEAITAPSAHPRRRPPKKLSQERTKATWPPPKTGAVFFLFSGYCFALASSSRTSSNFSALKIDMRPDLSHTTIFVV